MKKARSRAGTLFMFSLIEATVGLVLRAIEERFRLVGRIVAWLLGAAWSIARLFAVPAIISSDTTAVGAVKQSVLLLKSTWGENIAGRVTFGGFLLIFYLVVVLPLALVLLVAGVVIAGPIGAVIGGLLLFLFVVLISIIISAASSVLNTALFYYAQYRQIPPAFDAELLASVFIQRKKRRGFRKSKPAA